MNYAKIEGFDVEHTALHLDAEIDALSDACLCTATKMVLAVSGKIRSAKLRQGRGIDHEASIVLSDSRRATGAWEKRRKIGRAIRVALTATARHASDGISGVHVILVNAAGSTVADILLAEAPARQAEKRGLRWPARQIPAVG